MPISPTDDDWLAATARLAARGRPLSRPNPAVGCLIVSQGRIVGRGWTQPGGRPHAEATALAEAGARTRDATVYVTLEPCAHASARGPTCAELLAEAAPARVVVGAADPDPRTAGAGLARLRAAGIKADVMPCAAAAASLRGYHAMRTLGRPHVTLKLAVSADGFISPGHGETRWLTSMAARAHVHAHRAFADAILVGGATWRTDSPRLDVRLRGLAERSPRRLVLTQRDLPPGVTPLRAPRDIFALDGVQYLYLEGGASAAAVFMAERLVDRLEIYRAPVMLGAGIAAPDEIAPLSLADAEARWHLAERRMLGPDSFEAWDCVQSDRHEGWESACSPES